MLDDKNDHDVYDQYEEWAEKKLKLVVVFLAALLIIILYAMLK